MELGGHFMMKYDQHRPTERNSDTAVDRSIFHIG
jgi:hypothetical protein